MAIERARNGEICSLFQLNHLSSCNADSKQLWVVRDLTHHLDIVCLVNLSLSFLFVCFNMKYLPVESMDGIIKIWPSGPCKQIIEPLSLLAILLFFFCFLKISILS